MAKKKIFLTGASGFLGSKFVQLHGDDFEIFAVSRSHSETPIDLIDFPVVAKAFTEFQPDFVCHFAADLGRDTATAVTILETDPGITKHLVELAKPRNVPFIFASTEAVYGGKESAGNYKETDAPKPRSLYGQSKVLSETIIKESGLPYLITRGHRFVGVNFAYNRPKQFPDALRSILRGETIHCDSKKLFTPMFIDNMCDVLVHYIEHDADKQLVLNIGIDRPVTYFELLRDVSLAMNLGTDLVQSDGEEAGWMQNGTLCVKTQRTAGYPTVTYDDMIKIIAEEALV